MNVIPFVSGIALCLLVFTGGRAEARTLRVPGDFTTLGAALAEIAPGDTILVAPGEYSGPNNRDILVREKEFVLRSEKGAEQTIVDLAREPETYVLQLELQTRATLIDGFTFRRSSESSALILRSSGPIVRNCVFVENEAEQGGALHIVGTTPALIENCHFEGNAGGFGGAVYCGRLSLAEFESCRFVGNSSSDGGGALCCWDRLDIGIRNCLFAGNEARDGGAIFVFPNGPETELTIEGCTFADNSATRLGGGIRYSGRSRTKLSARRSIFYRNAADQGQALHVDHFSFLPELWCCAVSPREIFGTVDRFLSIDDDPLFCLGKGRIEDRYRLQSISPCVPKRSLCGEQIGAFGVGCEAGGGGACCLAGGECEIRTLDECDGVFQGVGRPCDVEPCLPGGACCLADECVTSTIEHCEAVLGEFLGEGVDCTPAGCPPLACCLEDGTCKVLPPRDCVDIGGFGPYPAAACDPNPCLPRVLRVPSEFQTLESALAAASPRDTVRLAPGTYSGSTNRELTVDGNELVITSEQGPETTILDCGGRGRAFIVGGREDSRVRIDGLTIRNGRAFSVEGSKGMGGAILVTTGSHVISNCILEDSFSSDLGGAVAALNTELSVVDSDIRGNVADRQIHSGNGGGIYADESLLDIRRTNMSANVGDSGGGIYAEETDIRIVDCLLSGNLSRQSGGAMSLRRCSIQVERCTIAGNRASGHGGGIATSSSRGTRVFNSVIWGNAARFGSEVYFGSVGGPDIFRCSVVFRPGLEGDRFSFGPDNHFRAPLYCDPRSPEAAPTSEGDYSVAENSVCLETNNSCETRLGAVGVGCSPMSIGACCDGKSTECYLSLEVECTSRGRVFLGENVPCEPSQCEFPAACCFNDGTCQLLVETVCLERDGRYQGMESTCTPQPCPVPQGCCVGSAECVLLPPVVCEEQGGRALDVDALCNEWTCTPNANGRVILHIDDELLPPTIEHCADIISSRPKTEGRMRAHVMAAFPPHNSPRLQRAAFGLTYDPETIEIISWGVHADSGSPSQDWPLPGSEIVVEWEEARTNHFEPLCWFEFSVLTPTASIEVLAHSGGAGFWDDLDSSTPETPVCHGTLGVGLPGSDCCWAVGACCVYKFDECFETTRPHCEGMEGYYDGDDTICPCRIWPVLLGNIRLEHRNYEAHLQWTASSDVGLRLFDVLRSEGEGAPVRLGLATETADEWRYEDASIKPGNRYSYWIEATEVDGAVERFGPYVIDIPRSKEPRLIGVHPNPTSGQVRLDLFLPSSRHCSAAIYDAAGRVFAAVDLGVLEAGRTEFEWNGLSRDGQKAPAGIYFVSLRSESWETGVKVVMIE